MKTPVAVRGVPHLEGRRVDLDWRNPPASDFEGEPPHIGIRITRRERTFPLGPDDGEVVYDGPVVTRFADRVPRPLTTYYYTVFAVDGAAAAHADDGSRATAYATARYDLADRLYRQLPAVHQRYDLPLDAAALAGLDPAVAVALAGLPSGLRDRGQLYRFLQAAAAPLDLMRSLAEGLRDLRDIDTVRPEFLVSLAEWIGWRLDRTLPVFAQRNEIKVAPRLYRTVGTVPNLRTIVTRYTGWFTQVAEMAQQIGRANAAPVYNVFAALEEGDHLRGVDDAAPILGFGANNELASGTGAVPAVLVSTVAGPFALRPGMELSVTADDRVPVVVRFLASDFISIAVATAAEVAAVLNGTLSEITARALPDNRIELRSNTVGFNSQLRIERSATSLVTLEGAPRGALPAFQDVTRGSEPRVRLFYETADPLGPATSQAAVQALQGQSSPAGPASSDLAPTLDVEAGPVRLPARPLGRVRYKTFRGGTWGPSFPIPAGTGIATSDPTAVQLPSGQIWVGWIENPHTANARLRFSVGTPRIPRRARLVGQRNQPFSLVPGTHLLIRGSRGLATSFEVSASDFADLSQATATEVVTALNARLSGVVATAEPNRTIALSTPASGGDERLEIDLRHSSAAGALGFDAANAAASGDWGDEIDWNPPEDVDADGRGRLADLSAVVDAAGRVWVFWASHVGGSWQIFSSVWDTERWTRAEQLSAGLAGNREPRAVLDDAGLIWLFWSAREALGSSQDNWTIRRRVFRRDDGEPLPRDDRLVRIRLPEVRGAWSSEAAATTVPGGGRARDREVGVVLLPNRGLRLYFQSNRNGGPDLWSANVDPSNGAVSGLAPVLDGPTDDRAPAPIRMPDGSLWLLYRSDRGVPLSRVALRPLAPIDNRRTSRPLGRDAPAPASLPVPRVFDTGALRRFAGTSTVVLTDAARNGRRRRFDDLLAFTPQGVNGREVLRDDDLYTRGTVGLYVSGLIPESPVSQPMVERLRAVLERFLPINTRAVVILAPRVDIELVYPRGADIEEIVTDKHPDIEQIGLPEETVAVALPDWVVLLSTTPGHVSADPANLPTLRRRTLFPPPS